jgi:multicomponent Na+:H+ antiporter subunit B
MSRGARLGLFAVSGAVLGALLLWGLTGLPAFGDFHGEYGRILNSVAGPERHVTNVVSAVVFDYRGFDTLGEEFILFASVMAVALLLREARDERERPRDEVRSDAVRAVGLALVGPVVVLGLYVVAHGYLTPGGGFQGGVVLAAGLLLLYAAGRYRSYRAASPQTLVDFAEGIGAGGYAAVGIAALVAGAAYLANVVDLGTKGTLAAAGTIPILNAASGLAVAAALILLFHEFLEEVMYPNE